MNAGTPIPQYEKAQSIPAGSTYIAEMGDGSGTKGVTQEILTQEVGKGLKIGDTEELQTENKESIVKAINEVANIDILDTKEEIEANTESGKVAGAQALKEMFGEVNSNLCTFKTATTTSEYIDGAITFVKIGNIGFIGFYGNRMIIKKSIPAGADIFNFPAGFKPKYPGFAYFYYGANGNFKIVSYSGDKLSNHSDVINNGDWFSSVPFMYFVS